MRTLNPHVSTLTRQETRPNVESCHHCKHEGGDRNNSFHVLAGATHNQRNNKNNNSDNGQAETNRDINNCSPCNKDDNVSSECNKLNNKQEGLRLPNNMVMPQL
uniref:Uncharacterized protein n=1 Tax=Lygus hesperus TaxID=30085 RepID=A0A0A9XHJ7_LYGHE